MGVASKNDNWYIDYRLPNGKRRREKIGKSKKLAETILAKRHVEIAENKYLDRPKNQRIKFEMFADEYLTLHSKANKKSWKSDFYNLQTLKQHFSGKFLYEVTVKDIEQFKSDRLKIISQSAQRCKTFSSNDQELKAVSPATVNRELATLKTMLGKAVVWGKLHKNESANVQFLREPKGRLRFLEREEIIKLLTNCSKKLRPIVVLALNTGMRRGEILGLKWTDVDLKRNILTLVETKNGEKREVPINEQVKTALLRVPKHSDSPYVFGNKDGKPLHDIRKSFSTGLAKSGIKDFRFHDLRHTFASQLVMVGIDLNTTRELLGHKDLRMTLRYAHLSPNYKQRAVDILGKKLDTFWTLSPNSQNTTQMSNTQHIENKDT